MVQPLDSVVSKSALVFTYLANFVVLNIIAHVRGVEIALTPHVNVRVEVTTVLMVVLLRI